MLALATGCASRRPVALDAGSGPAAIVRRAIAARGGPLPGLVRESEVQVARAFPGIWRWRTVAAPPERYAWSIETNDQPNHYLFDGTTVRAFVGDAPVSDDPSPSSPLRTHARFTAVADLDILLTPAAELTTAVSTPDGVTLTAVFRDRNHRYEVAFDHDGLLTRVAGPIDLSPAARGHLVATYDDYRQVDARRIPHHIHYDLDGQTLADEHVITACVLATPPDATIFTSPERLPTCKKAST